MPSTKFMDHSFLQGLAKKSRNGNARWTVESQDKKLSYVFVAIEPKTYVRPHRHEQAQFTVVLSGKIALLTFDESGNVTDRTVVGQGEAIGALEIPGGVYHACVALTEGAVVLEITEPNQDKEYLASSPRHGTSQATEWVERWSKGTVIPLAARSALRTE